MNVQQLRRIIRQESPSRLGDGIVVSIDARGTRTASVRVSGGHVHSRVYTCDETLEIGDQVVIARLEGLARMVVIGKIVSQHGSPLSKQGILAPPNNFTALTFAGVAYCQWDTYPGEDISWEIQYSLNGSPYSDATKVLVSRGSYYFYPCTPGTTVHFRARGIRWIGDNNLMYSGWSGWANVTCADYEVPRLLVELTNKAGKQVEEGWVVVIDKANANSFKTTIGADDEDVIGVAFETIADNATGLICISGLIDVYVSDTPSIGDYLISSVTEGNATGSASTSKGCFGRALTTKAGNTVSAIIDPPIAGAAGVLGHNLFSAEHPDTLADAVLQGDIMVGSATPLWARLAKGAADLILKMNAGGTDPEWGEPPITSIAGYSRGAIFRAGAADWEVYDAKTDKQILVGDGTDIVSVPISLDVTLANTGAATVVGIQGRVVGGGAPADGQVYAWNDVASEWQPVDQAAAEDLGIGGSPTFKADGVPIVISGVDGAYVCPGAGEIAAVYLHCAATGTISDVPNTIVDVNLNGITIFTDQLNRPTLAWNDADHVAKSGVPNISTLAELDVLTVDIDQVATGASGLSVVISLAGGGGIIMIEIQQDDVKVTDVTVINFEGGGGKVTDEGGGKATIDITGSPGDSTHTATYAARPAASNDGDLFLPSDGFVTERDTGAAWVPWGPIFPLVAPISGDFAWVNQNDTVLSTTKGGVNLTDPAQANNNANYALRVKATPGLPYTITALFLVPAQVGVSYTHPLLFGWRQSSDGKLVMFRLYFNTNWRYAVLKATNPTTDVADYVTLTTLMHPGPYLWVRIADDSTDRLVSISADGQNFIEIHSVGRTDYLTPDQVLWGLCSRNVTYASTLTLLSWEEA